MNRRFLVILAALVFPSLALAQTVPIDLDKPIQRTKCRSRLALEFIAPTLTEEVPNFHPTSPNPDAWTIVLEISAEQEGPPIAKVREGTYVPSPGAAAMPPTDVNGDAVIGDPHPAIPGLRLVMDDMLGGIL